MTIKKAGSAKSTLYNGVHGNLSAEVLEVVLDGVHADDLYYIGDYPVGSEIKQIKVFNDAIGNDHTVQFFISDRHAINTPLTEEIDAQDSGVFISDELNFYVGDRGPVGLYMVVSPTENVEDITIDFPDDSTPKPVTLTELTIDYPNLQNCQMRLGASSTVVITTQPEDYDVSGAVFKSSNTDAVTVGVSNGKINGVGLGDGVITCELEGIKAVYGLTVIPPLPAFTVEPKSVTVYEGESVSFHADAGEDVTYEWYVSEDDGSSSLLAEQYPNHNTDTLGPWAATLDEDGYQFMCRATNSLGESASSSFGKLTVKAPQLTIDYPTLSDNAIHVGKKADVVITTVPEDYDVSGASFSSSNPSVASVNAETGVILGKTEGNTKLTCEVGELIAEYALTVFSTSPEFTVEPQPVTVAEGEAVTFSAEAKNADAYIWTVDTEGSGGFEPAEQFPNYDTNTLGPWSALAEQNGYSFSCTAINSKTGEESTHYGVGLTVTPVPLKLTELTINYPTVKNNITYVGEVSEVTLTTTPKEYGTSGATFTSSEESVVSIDAQTGEIEAKAIGTAEITCSLEGLDATYSLTVEAPLVVITSQPEDAEALIGGEVSLSVEAKNAKTFKWLRKSANDQEFSAADDFPNYQTKQLGPWDAEEHHDDNLFYCTLTNASGRSVNTKEVRLTIIPLTEIAIDYPDISDSTVVQGSSTGAAVITTTPEGGDVSKATFSSSNTAIATVNATTGSAKGIAAGTATITCTLGTLEGTYKLTVQKAPDAKITSQPESMTVKEGEPLSFTVKADNAASYKWQWKEKSSDNGVSTAEHLPNYTTATLGPWDAELTQNGNTFRCAVMGINGTEIYSYYVTATVTPN